MSSSIDTSAGQPKRHGMLAPFGEPGFRYQWPADLATSLAFDMEMIILAWYVFVETKSVTMLTIFASMQYLGTLIAPMFGVMGDRIGHRNVLAAMRGVYTLCALTSAVSAGLLLNAYRSTRYRLLLWRAI